MVGNEETKILPPLVEKIDQWWLDLRKERRCSSTSVVAKLVNKASFEEQDKARELISHHIKQGIIDSIKSKDIAEIHTLCNAINGCFDNFQHAADAVNISFNEIIHFIDICIDDCTDRLFIKKIPKCSLVKILELLHCLSRILVLSLKLRRPLRLNDVPEKRAEIDNCIKNLLSGLSYKVSCFLKVDYISMDTKYNFVMSSLLIREIIVHERERLLQYHQAFLATLPQELYEEDYELNVFKFLLGNAVLNTWSNIVMDSHSTRVYLRFFIQLCESYSSDTPIVLNISRSLLLLIKNECFTRFLADLGDKESQEINSLLTCVWMLLDHPVACVRSSARDFLQTLAFHDKFKSAMQDSLSKLSSEKRSYYMTLAALANASGTRILLQIDSSLPRNLILSLYDPTLVSHVIFALERLILEDSLVHENFSEWCETWIVPLLMCLSKVPLVVAADIEKLLDGLFKANPSAVFYIINKWSEPDNDEEIRYVITALKINNKHGFKLRTNTITEKSEGETAIKREGEQKKWKDLISEKLLHFCLHHNDDDIRISAFSLLIQGQKSTEIYTQQDFDLIKYFLKYNLNNQHPATRQKILSLLTKMIVRYAESLTVVKRNLKSKKDMLHHLSSYSHFKQWLISFCLSNIFDGVNFNRLNTVLSILLCSLDNMEVVVDDSELMSFWNRIFVALRSSYEENKIMTVALAKKLELCKMLPLPELTIEILFERAVNLCGKIEPPNVLTGSYLIQMLMEFRAVKQIAKEMLPEDDDTVDDTEILCIEVLTKELKKQVEDAEKNLIRAAMTGPMYGLLSVIRLIFQGADFSKINPAEGCSDDVSKSIRTKWSSVLNDVIGLSIRMIHVVSSVVNSPSPEGHLPSDFQKDLDLMFNEGTLHHLSEGAGDVKGVEQTSSREQIETLRKKLEHLKLTANTRTEEELIKDCWTLIWLFNNEFLSVYRSTSLSQKDVADLTITYESCLQLASEMKKTEESSSYLRCLNSIQKKIRKHTKSIAVSDGRPTAQVLLLCAWRSIKEACLFIGDLFSKLPLEETLNSELITEEKLMTIGEELRMMLCEIMHRGAFEQAYIGFSQLINALWKCPRKNLSELPGKWLKEILDEIKLPLEKQKLRLCSSRRSAGLPFLVQAIISSELNFTKSAKIQTLEITMNSLLEMAEKEDESVSVECKIHSLNILRALFKHAMLGDHVAPYVSRALMVAIRGSRASAWSIRNSCNLLFSSLVIRIFGVARNRDSLSKKNRMTSRTFFQRYPELYEFFLSEMKLALQVDLPAHDFHPQPNVFHILLILGRLYPPPTEDLNSMDFSEFLPLIKISCRNPTLKIRELGARALVPLISPEKFKGEMDLSFGLLHKERSGCSNNERHGVLLQLKTILTEMSVDQPKLIEDYLEGRGSVWIKNTNWILNSPEEGLPYVIRTSYLHVLYLMFRLCRSLRNCVKGVISGVKVDTETPKQMAVPGRFVFLEMLHFVRFDIAADEFLECGNGDELTSTFLTMLKSPLVEVQGIPLRFLNFVLLGDRESEDDDVNSIAASIKDLTCTQTDAGLKLVKESILSNHQILQHITNHTVNFLLHIRDYSLFVHKVITRLWLSVISNLLLQDLVTVNDVKKLCDGDPSSLVNSLMYLIDCEDSDISVSAFVCYAILFFDAIAHDAEKPSSELVSRFVKLVFSFSDEDADLNQRMAVADVLNKYYCFFRRRFFVEDNLALSIWMLPVRLICDDDPLVRRKAMGLVPKYQKLITEELQNEAMIIPFDGSTQSQLTVVPPKAQEYLLTCYINMLGEKDLFHLFVQMVAWYLQAIVNTVNYENVNRQNEAGVFEKGNPNPFCEEFALASLLSSTIEQLKKFTDIGSLLRRKLDPTHISGLRHFFPSLIFPSFPETLGELGFHIATILSKDNAQELNSGNGSLLQFYITSINKVFDVS